MGEGFVLQPNADAPFAPPPPPPHQFKIPFSLIFILFSWLTSITPTCAQAQDGQKTAHKFDEFGDINYSDLKARLDNFAGMLTQQNDVVGFIVVYRSRRDLAGLSHSLALWMKDYLLNSRTIPRNRIAVIAYAQYNPRRELVDWVGDYEPRVDVRLDPPGTARNRLNLEKRV